MKEKIIEIHCAEEFDKMFLHLDSKYFNCRMELNEMEKRLLFQVEGDYQSKILNELYMTARYTKNLEQRKAAENLMEKLRVLTDAECMDIVRDIQKNYRLPYPARTIGEKIAEARQQSGAENEYYGAAEPPVRCGESHLSGLTEPPHFIY